jgi:tetratricopeptide (TPR) repeat protein
MTPEQWAEVKDRFHEAVNQPPDTAKAYLERVCSSAIVLIEVVRLLGEHRRAGSFLNQPAFVQSDALAVPLEANADFSGSHRFEVQERIGAGTFGVVYRVFDREQNVVVALKQLRQLKSANLLRFKREFRTLVDVLHPNLVQLYELFGDDQQWFFTMELVDGVDFLSYVRPGNILSSWHRLRDGLHQLATGVQALHSESLIHRDLKPSNVLVTAEGRAVILDFGLVSGQVSEHEHDQSFPLAGSPAYMAPEQTTGNAIERASDWYSIGVMLYQAITGQFPFKGKPAQISEQKRMEDAPRCSALATNVPDDLDEACRLLLHRNPEFRFKGASILLHKGREGPGTTGRSVDKFVGRRTELDSLRGRFEACCAGKRQAVLVRGLSGIGKTSLVMHFLNAIKLSRPDAVVLKGRCSPSEAVPYKALDPIVDELVRELKSFGEPVAAFLPTDLRLLRRMFPVLGDFPIANSTRDDSSSRMDDRQARRRAFEALSGLLGYLTARNPVLIWIDDLQWSDLDSIAFLSELIGSTRAPCLMLILSFRSENASTSPALQALQEFQQPDGDLWCQIEVGSLSDDEGRELLSLLQTPGVSTSNELSREIVKESRGSPMLLNELHRFASRKGDTGTNGVPAENILISEMIRHRASVLSSNARDFLEALSVAGEPLSVRALCGVAKTPFDDPAREVRSLVQEHLVRVTESQHGTKLEPFHDQVREASLAWLSPAQIREWHSRLVRLWEADENPDQPRLLRHYLGAGNLPAAYRAAVAAAEAAENALAFEQAARFYREALETGQGDDVARAKLHRKRAEVLAKAGRGYESSQSYLEAARQPDHNDLIEMRSLAAEQLMRSGHLDEGTQILADVLRTVGITVPATPLESVLRMLAIRAFIRIRGLRWRERRESEVPRHTLRKLDLLWNGALVLATANPVFSTYLQARHMLEALRAGEPYRVALSLSLGAWYESLGGTREYHRGRILIDLALQLAERLKDTYLSTIALACWAGVDCSSGRIKDGLAHSASAKAVFDDTNRAGRAWELATADILLVWFLGWGGRIRELSERLPLIIKEGRSRGDVYAEVAVRCVTTGHLVDLARNDPDGAIEATVRAIKQWRKSRYDIQHFGATFACIESHLYAGRTKEARELLLADWTSIRRSLIFRKNQTWRVILSYVRGRTALAEWLRSPEINKLRVEAEEYASKLCKLGSPWGDALALLLRAGIKAGGDQVSEAILLLERAEEILRQQDLWLLAAAALRRRGELLGPAGKERIDAADAFMRSESILRPDLMTAMILPGKWLRLTK